MVSSLYVPSPTFVRIRYGPWGRLDELVSRILNVSLLRQGRTFKYTLLFLVIKGKRLSYSLEERLRTPNFHLCVTTTITGRSIACKKVNSLVIQYRYLSPTWQPGESSKVKGRDEEDWTCFGRGGRRLPNGPRDLRTERPWTDTGNQGSGLPRNK